MIQLFSKKLRKNTHFSNTNITDYQNFFIQNSHDFWFSKTTSY